MKLFKLCKRVIAVSILSLCMNSGLSHADDYNYYSFKMGFVDPESSSYALGGKKFADEVARLTDGHVKIQIIAGGLLGGESDMYEAVESGAIDIITIVNTVLTRFIPEMKLLDQLYLFDDEKQAHAVIDGPLFKLIQNKAAMQGVHILGAFESGFRDTFSKNPITRIEDFVGLKIRAMENAMQKKAFEALGAIPFPMSATEQTSALRSGRINAIENAPGHMLVNRYYEIIQNVTTTRHQFTYVFAAMSDQCWQLIPEKYHDKILEAMRIAVEWQRKNLMEINAQAKAELENKKVTYHEIDREKLKAIIKPATAPFLQDIPKEWTDAFNAGLKNAR